MCVSATMLILQDAYLHHICLDVVTIAVMKWDNKPTVWLLKFNLFDFLKLKETIIGSYRYFLWSVAFVCF